MRPCPVLGGSCEYYSYQLDNNGEVAICYCSHRDNVCSTEGNCTKGLCPLCTQPDITVETTPIGKLAELIARDLFSLGDNIDSPCKRLEFKGVDWAKGTEAVQGGIVESAVIKQFKHSIEKYLGVGGHQT